MWGLASHASACGYTAQPSASSFPSSNAWVASQLSTPLPPHHRQHGRRVVLAMGARSLQTFFEPKNDGQNNFIQGQSSDRDEIRLRNRSITRQTLCNYGDPVQAGTAQAGRGLGNCVATRASKAAQPAVNGLEASEWSSRIEQQSNSSPDLDLDPGSKRSSSQSASPQPVIRHRSAAARLSSESDGEWDGDMQSTPAATRGVPDSAARPPPRGATLSTQYGAAAAGGVTSARPRQGYAPRRAPRDERSSPEGPQRDHRQARVPTSHSGGSPEAAHGRAGPACEKDAADKALLVSILRSPRWTSLQDLLQRHQEQHLEALRLAAAAAAAADAAAPTTPTAQAEPVLDLSSTVGDQDGGRQGRSHGPAHHPRVPMTAPPHAQVEGQLAAVPHQPAFTARHLSTALHVTAQLVADPGALSNAERLQLADFVRDLGRGCASLAARDAFAPVDVTMALRALARLLGEVRMDQYVAADMFAPGSLFHADEDDYEGFDGPRPRSDWHDDDAVEDDVGPITAFHADGHESSTNRAAGRTLSRRGLYAAWLSERWADELLAPTLDFYLQDFEPRHVPGVLWSLATLGLRPRPEILGALCERAAQCARATAAAAVSAGRAASSAASGGDHGSPQRGKVSQHASSEDLLTPQGLSLILWSLAKLGFQPSQSTLGALLAASAADMRAVLARADRAHGPHAGVQACCSLDIAQRAWALATLGRHPGPELLDLMVRAFLTRGSVEQVSGQSLSMFSWGLSRLHALGRHSQHQQAASRAKSDSVAAAALRQGVRPIPAREWCDNEDGDQVDDAGLLRERMASSMSASSSGRDAGGAPSKPPSVPHGGLRTAAGQVDGFAGPGPALPRSQVVVLMALLHDGFGRMTSQHLATVLWAVADLDVRPSRAWLEAYLDASAWRMTQSLKDSPVRQPFGAQALVMMLSAMARVQYRPPFRWMAHFMEVSRVELPAFSPRAVCTLAWALVRLSFRPPGHWARDFAAVTEPVLPAMPPEGLSMLLWSTAQWRTSLPGAWIGTALAVSARHLRSTAEAWQRDAAVLEARAAALANHSSSGKARGSGRLGLRAVGSAEGRLEDVGLKQHAMRPEMLACIMWAVPRLVARRPPARWLSLAESATQAVMRHSQAGTAVIAAEAQAQAQAEAQAVRGGNSTSRDRAGSRMSTDIGADIMDARTLTMLLQGWARLRAPLAEGCLAAALSYVADAATAAVAAGESSSANGQAGGPVGPAPGSARLAASVGPQHIALALWASVMVGGTLSPELRDRLVDLHLELSKQQRRDVRALGEPGPAEFLAAGDSSQRASSAGAELAAMAVTAGAAAPSEKEIAQRELLLAQRRRLRLAETLAAQQAELGMLLFALLHYRATSPPDWLPEVLVVVGNQLEREAAAATAAPPAAATEAAGSPWPPAVASGPSTVPPGGAAGLQSRSPNPLQGGEPQRRPRGPVPAVGQSALSLLTVTTLARACIAWRVYPGDRWLAAVSTCLDAGVLTTTVRRRRYGRANQEAKLRFLVAQLGAMRESSEGSSGSDSDMTWRDPTAAIWAAAEAAGGAVLTNAVAAMAAGSAAAWMQGLVW